MSAPGGTPPEQDDPDDPKRKQIQHPIPTRPADPAAAGEGDKVATEGPLVEPDYNAPPPPGTVKSTGKPLDGAGAGQGQPPGALKPAAGSGKA